jgi:hypothetical protein
LKLVVEILIVIIGLMRMVELGWRRILRGNGVIRKVLYWGYFLDVEVFGGSCKKKNFCGLEGDVIG